MWRITASDDPRVITFRLEGRLEGSWSAELENYLQSMIARVGRLKLRVDLTGITHIDPAGMAHLAAMHDQGAEFIANDILTKSIVEEIEAMRSANNNEHIERMKS